MKKGNLEQWKDISGCNNLLFFSQLVNELLFDYSIPSNRVSTLNSHYLCLDALNAIDGIENHGVPEGTLKPIMEELFLSLQKDPAFLDETIHPLSYFLKYQNERYITVSRVTDLSYNDLSKTAEALFTIFFKDDLYYEKLKTLIIKIVTENTIDKQKQLFRLVKSLLTELMNHGYSLRYIYEVMNRLFWNSKAAIESPDCIMRFFDAFRLTVKEYEVIFVVNKHRIEKFVGYIEGLKLDDNLQPRFNTHGEKQFYNKKNRESFLIISIQALDPFSAVKNVKDMLSVNAAIYRLFDHNYKYNITSVSCGVYDDKEFYKMGQTISAVEHTKTLSSKRIAESMSLANKAFKNIANNHAYDDLASILNAARFHSHSLDSISEENQLLDFWAIFEALLDISNKHTSDRIQQICMHLVPILKRNYIQSLFQQLYTDIKNYNEDLLKRIINEKTDEDEIIEELFCFIALEGKKNDREEVLSRCADFPLLQERIKYYSEVLGSTQKVYQFVEKHAERVKWQIMRIYRNRNLIIHNAETMPYLSLLIENLHSYVDDFLSYALHTMAKGHDIESMCQELFVKECQWSAAFQRKDRLMNETLVKQVLSF